MVSTLTYEQRLKRLRGFGGSDMCGLSGLHPNRRPIDVYRSKVEPKLQDDEDMGPDVKRGIYLEPGIRQWYAAEVGAYVKEPGTLVHPDCPGGPDTPAIMATADGLAQFADGRPDRGVEIKAPRFCMVHHWCDGEWPRDLAVPAYHIPQVTTEAAVLGVEVVDVAALLGDELYILPVPFDPDVFDSLRYLAEKFWRDHILPRRPPPPDQSTAYAEYLAQRHPRAIGDAMLEANEEAVAHAKAWERERLLIKAAEERRQAHRNWLQNYIGDAPGLDLGPYGKLTWRNNRDATSYDYAALVRDHGLEAVLDNYKVTKPGPRVFRGNVKEIQDGNNLPTPRQVTSIGPGEAGCSQERAKAVA